MDTITEYLPFLLPIVLVELALGITAFIHVQRHRQYRFGNRLLWSIAVLILQIIGPVIYFTVGRGDR